MVAVYCVCAHAIKMIIFISLNFLTLEALINAIATYIPLSNEEEDLVGQIFQRKEFRKKDFLLKEGNICRSVYFIEKGLVRYYVNLDGEEKTTYFNKENEFVCDYMSFLPKSPSKVNIQALEDVIIWSIDYDNLQRFYQEIRNGERLGRLAIEQVYLQAIGQVASFYTDPPEIRYLNFIHTYPDLQQRIAQFYIASYVGVKPQSLSRIRRRITSSH
ncbi:cAMP-binding domain of CRP or a regulatory subunit of cAMP-dependent protein kinases [Arachidicoccus rhizosphaerae]|uniref:cAMP-binding domain of CRP or a regulatory subunit of cAMP-dependent protein kinases n=1 Tax=Arachidicoccus rhizosphaerae TaxID=551991 RepID=A0A1H4CTN1_9BACT|nr:cAMP-binding domain of CRP or a regulatory subunit of cAMP-dependent protein kinases [Arachidicoccus rhizosphaerae]